ncbi:Signal peptidase complex-like protein DTM1 [Rhynchospora pubera]|uniref:Signal peptidase complex-like protein DTM1 n=1 Tax=Rhynchospora pubera TaxID=906938 RepID=A0AAV8FK70_9POAL|nr:Signal peptidase complex-like protein DTM1 [Rhynchospora pubera]
MPASFPLTPLHHFLNSHSPSSNASVSRARSTSPVPMGRDEALQRSLVGLAVVMVLVGIATLSFKKVLATYAFGLFAVAGILLPDWEFFDRDFSQWFTPMPATRSAAADRADDTWKFKFYPLRIAVLSTVYGVGFYKWWTYISS